MNNGEMREFRRGEVYWRMYGEGYLSQAHRPALIVSAEFAHENQDFVLVVAIGSANGRVDRYDAPIVSSTGKESVVFCNQIECVSKDKLKSYMCTLTDDEMERVDRAVKRALGLDEISTVDPEKVEMAKKIAVMKKQIEGHEDEKTSVEVERDMYKKLYDKALDELCAVKMGRDMATRVVAPAPEAEKEEPKEEPPVEEPAPAPEAELVDINSCNGATLRNIGCIPGQIKEIIDNRPYNSIEDLKSLRMMNKMTWAYIKRKICCIPVAEPEKKVVEKKVGVVIPPVVQKPERVNVNTATVEEMVEIAGLSQQTAKMIGSYRNKHGKFVSVEDLLNVPRFGKVCLLKYGPKLEV